jgi:hypothetical protein
MFKVKNMLFNPKVDEIVKKITTTTKFNVKTTFSIVKFKAEYDRLVKLNNEVRQKLINKYCDKNEDGTPKTDGNQYSFTETAEQFTMDMNEFALQESEFNMDKIVIEVKDVPEGFLTVNDIIVLSAFIEFKD